MKEVWRRSLDSYHLIATNLISQLTNASQFLYKPIVHICKNNDLNFAEHNGCTTQQNDFV